MREGMVFYKSWIDALEDVPAEEFKKAVMAMAAYGLDDVEPELDGIAKVIFSMARPTIDRRKADSENGARGGRPSKKPAEEKRGVSEKEKGGFSKPKSTETETDTETEYILSPDGDKRARAGAVIAAWNNLPEPIPKVSRAGSDSTRMKMLNARIAEHGIDNVMKAVNAVGKSDFLKGKNGKGWIITIDWFLKPNNFVKVMDGNYANAPRAANKKTLEFNNFHQREYDYDALQRELIAKQMKA